MSTINLKTIPTEWRHSLMDDYITNGVIELTRGNVISKKDIQNNPGNNPIYSSSIHGGALFGKYNPYMFDEELITWSVDGGGNFFYRPKHKFSVTNVSGILRILKKDRLIYKYLFYLLDWEHSFFKFDYQDKAHPSVIRKMYNILEPSLFEQEKIVEVLSSIDDEIKKIDEIIFKTIKLKTGLMTHLFAKGIGHKKFKKTKIGGIPMSWDVGGFNNIVDPKNKNAIKPGPFGSALKKSFYVEKGFKIYGQEQVISGDITYGDYYIDEEKYKDLEGFKVNAGDILISLVGTIGKVLVISESFEKGIINPRLLKITVDRKKADPQFIAYLLKSDFLIQQMNQKSHGGTMNILNKGMLMGVNFGIPPLDEQKEITKIISAVDEKISINIKHKEALIKLKKGLMQDLLSGKVRTKASK
jgi:type I restriction enzyme S subunit